MLHLLGGPPRIGKSLIAAAMARRHGIRCVSTDVLGATLEQEQGQDTAPGLFVQERIDALSTEERIHLMAEDTDRRIAWLVEEAEATWEAVPPLLRREHDGGRDVLVEGVAVLPHLAATLDFPELRALFVGHRGDGLEESLRTSLRQNEDEWLRDVSGEELAAWATFVRRMSDHVEREAREHGFPYVEMGDAAFHESVERVITTLTAKGEQR